MNQAVTNWMTVLMRGAIVLISLFAAAWALIAMANVQGVTRPELLYAFTVWVSLSGVLHGYFNKNLWQAMVFIGASTTGVMALIGTLDVQLLESQWNAYFSSGQRAIMGNYLFEILSAIVALTIQLALFAHMAVRLEFKE